MKRRAVVDLESSCRADQQAADSRDTRDIFQLDEGGKHRRHFKSRKRKRPQRQSFGGRGDDVHQQTQGGVDATLVSLRRTFQVRAARWETAETQQKPGGQSGKKVKRFVRFFSVSRSTGEPNCETAPPLSRSFTVTSHGCEQTPCDRLLSAPLHARCDRGTWRAVTA